MLFFVILLSLYCQGVPEFVSRDECTYIVRWESISACPTQLPVSPTSRSGCSIRDPFSSEQNLSFLPFIRNLNLVTPDKQDGMYAIQLCGTSSPFLPPGCDQSNTGICRLGKNGTNTTLVYADHFFTIVSHLPRVIDAMFISGIPCYTNRNQNWTAIVHMVCSNTEELAVPRLISDNDCELHFDWRNQSFCAGESASRGCMATDEDTGYVFSLDSMLSQKWMVCNVARMTMLLMLS